MSLTGEMQMNTQPTQQQACAAMVQFYDEARAQLVNFCFGKELDRRARKLALKLAGISLPEGMNISWATPEGWGHGRLRYRAKTAEEMIK